jgi:hypothetical protein
VGFIDGIKAIAPIPAVKMVSQMSEIQGAAPVDMRRSQRTAVEIIKVTARAPTGMKNSGSWKA